MDGGCHSFENGNWNLLLAMASPRVYRATIFQITNDSFLIIGKMFYQRGVIVCITNREILYGITHHGVTNSFKLGSDSSQSPLMEKYENGQFNSFMDSWANYVYEHCTAQISDTTFLLSGGNKNGLMSIKEVFLVDVASETATQQDDMVNVL